MMDFQNQKRYVIAGLIGLLVFCAGILVGQVGGPKPAEDAAAVFAAVSSQDAGEDLLLDEVTALPQETPENWFAIEAVSSPSPEPPEPETSDAPLLYDPAATEEPGFHIELVREETEASTQGEGRAKRVLIYHTHTYEAYQQTTEDPYRETEEWRTEDERHNIISVGEELAALLRSMGVEVVHDATAFEPPDLNTSYTRSLEMLEKRQELGESYDLYLDLHRDAYVASQSGTNAVALGGGQVAKVMLLIGKGEGQTGEGFEEKPPWEENLAIAQEITNELNAELPGLGKEVRIKSGRFNQHIGVGCVLVEVGNNRNTLEEAKAAMPYLADAICAVLASGK